MNNTFIVVFEQYICSSGIKFVPLRDLYYDNEITSCPRKITIDNVLAVN